jgi:DNA-binding Lrp family transcriptional regulator
MANGKYQRDLNNFLILQTLSEKHLSRMELANELNLQPSTVTYAITRLRKVGLIKDFGGDINQGMGRKRTFLGLDGSYGCVFGIELLVGHFSASIVDISGKVIFECSQCYPSNVTKMKYLTVERFEEILKVILTLLEEKAKDLTVIAACIAIAGTVDSTGKKVLYSWTHGLKNYDGSQFFSNYSYPTFFENDANCAAISHMDGRRDTFLYTLVQQYDRDKTPEGVPPIGVGMGLVIDGELRRGFNNKSGEFNSIMYRGDATDKQLALTNIELLQLDENEDLLKKFLIELFGNLYFVESLIDPRIIYMGGSLSKWKHLSRYILDKEFKNSRYQGDHDTFVFVEDPKSDVKKGAWQLLLYHLFKLPEVDLSDTGWESLGKSLIPKN